MNRSTADSKTSLDAADLSRRFRGIARLYGDAALAAFQRSRVCVAGIGGVGSWVVEALARSGIGGLTLIDLDHVSESNTNRQIHSLESNFGKPKVEAMRQRVAEINPACHLICLEEFVTPQEVENLIDVKHLEFVVDCTDQIPAKVAIIDHCRRNRCPVITTGAAGGRRDPTKIRVDDLSCSVHDSLLAKTRRQLRRYHGFRRTGLMGVKCIYSYEQAKYPQPDGSIAPVRAPGVEGSLHCGGFGSATHVTASFGFAAVAYVLERLARREAGDLQ